MTNPRQILILGAGAYQLGLIRAARRMGLVTHVVSYAGNFPGIREADHFHESDTRDIPRVLELARRLRVDAVATSGTDVCIPTVGAVCDALGLRGVSEAVARRLSVKDAFRKFQHDHDIRAPRYKIVEKKEKLEEALRELRAPMIIKPVDASGSRGVARLEAGAENGETERLFEAAKAFSACGRVCVEELLPGVEVGGNAMLHEGRIAFLAITEKRLDGFVVRGHAYPTNITEPQREAVRRELERCCAALGYATGALNFDVMVDGKEAAIIEVGARLGGNGLTDLITHAYDYDIESDVIRLALGEAPRLAPGAEVRPCGSWVFGSARGGRLRRAPTLEELKKKVPEVYYLFTACEAGEEVRPFIHNVNMLGYALFTIPPGENWTSMTARLEAAMEIEVETIADCGMNISRGSGEVDEQILTGERVRLRRLEESDLDRTHEWLHRPDVNDKIGVAIPFSKEQQLAWFRTLAGASDKVVFAVCRRGDGSHIGNVSLDTIDRRHRNARLSIFLAEPGERGQGLGSDALRTLCRYAFEGLGLHKVWCKTDADDARVLRFYERLGFVREGTLREHEFKQGRFVDKAIFGLIREE